MDNSNPITLCNCLIVTVDPEDRTVPDGKIIIQDGRISRIGPSAEIPSLGKEIDLGGRIVMPGLVNTHTHSPSSIFRGYADDLPLHTWLEEHLWPAERKTTRSSVLAASRLAYLEFLMNGMTTNIDMWYFANEVFRAAEESGLRSFVCAGIFSFPSPESDHSLRDAEMFVQQHLSSSYRRVQPGFGPHDAYSCSPDILRRVADLAEKTGVLTTIHLSEAPGDNEEILRRYGKTPAEYVESCGIFRNRTVCAHGCHLSENDARILAENGASVSYNPVSNMKLCDGIMPYRMLRDSGVCLSFGVDGAQSNNSLDLLKDAKTGCLLQKVQSGDPALFSARDTVRMLTVEGAKAVGMEQEIGSIEVGKRADLITLDTDCACMLPLAFTDFVHLYSHIVYAGSSVNDVFVDGECLLRDKQPVRVDAEEIKRSLRGEAQSLYRRV